MLHARLAALLLAALPVTTFAHSPHFCGGEKPHPIDAALDRAIDASGGTTYDMREAQGAAYEAWDKELNKAYKALLAELDKPQADALRAAQRAWLAWDAAEASWTQQTPVYGDGTAATLMIAGDALDRRRERVCELQGYSEGVRENNK